MQSLDPGLKLNAFVMVSAVWKVLHISITLATDEGICSSSFISTCRCLAFSNFFRLPRVLEIEHKKCVCHVEGRLSNFNRNLLQIARWKLSDHGNSSTILVPYASHFNSRLTGLQISTCELVLLAMRLMSKRGSYRKLYEESTSWKQLIWRLLGSCTVGEVSTGVEIFTDRKRNAQCKAADREITDV